MTATTSFWDNIADTYSKRPITDEAAYQKKLEITRGYFNPDMDVLEVGCGTGGTAILHAPYVKHLQAIDCSSRMIEIARAKQEKAHVGNVTFDVSGIEQLTARDQSFDAVLGLSILHLLEGKDSVIRKVHRILKPGGTFVTSTMCLNDSFKYLKLIAPIGRILGVMPPFLNFFTTKELEQSLKSAGFHIDYLWQVGKRKATFIVAKKAS